MNDETDGKGNRINLRMDNNRQQTILLQVSMWIDFPSLKISVNDFTFYPLEI